MFSRIVFALLSLLLLCLIVVQCESNEPDLQLQVSQLVDQLVNESVYNKNVRPNFGGQPVKVAVNLIVGDINSISEVNMEIGVDFILRQYWNDSRLAFKPVGNITKMTLGVDFLNKIWRPNTFLSGSRKLDLHASVGQSNSLLRIKHTGEVLYSVRMSSVVTCNMYLRHFPADKQTCDLTFVSYDYGAEDLIYNWIPGDRAVRIGLGISLPTFTLVGFRKSAKTTTNPETGSFSRLKCEIDFEREIGFYLYQIYIPAFLMVVISWIPFWLDRDHHARVGLGVTTVLTITTLATGSMESLPKVSYLKAIDFYLFTCFLMVFLSLIEYATVGYFESKSPEEEKDKSEEQTPSLDNNKNNSNPLKKPSRIDYYARTLFPLVFILFNAIYIYYIMQVKGQDYD